MLEFFNNSEGKSETSTNHTPKENKKKVEDNTSVANNKTGLVVLRDKDAEDDIDLFVTDPLPNKEEVT